ncbi:hypothetical protein [Paracoccus sp. S3-43]|uniref:hypothetical protein n=1 Tax=Paracoccus sp. S3-43 TaxID=3030011 RepID=UPI0023AFAE19|nr:hypothetical protein [Paracoccus sp. S3-43]WEF25148.1 hypothetical protein PXD02_04175 [Paracoccus sp. S3-43]
MHLRLFLIHIWVASIAGAVVIAGLALGYFGVATFVWGAVIGLALGIPAALLNWVYLRPNRSQQIGWTWPIANRIRSAAKQHPSTR